MSRFELQPGDRGPARQIANAAGRATQRARSTSPLVRGAISGALVFVISALLALGSGLVGYVVVAGSLSEDGAEPNQLGERVTSEFQTTRIYDRDENLLNEALDANEGRRNYVKYELLPKYLIDATVATEDANFWEHPGVDPIALIRAIYYAVREREFVSGGSTISQQLAKRVFLSPERTLDRKIKEAVLSAEITRFYRNDRAQILEFYLNEIYYGNLAYGAAAAAETYFGKNVSELTLAESAYLAGLPQLPAYYDPYQHPDRAEGRMSVVLGLMVEQEKITAAEADAAWREKPRPIPPNYDQPNYNLRAPHFVVYVRQQLEQMTDLLGTAEPLSAGFVVETSLDLDLQEQAQQIVLNNVSALSDRNVSNGALVAMKPDTGEVLAFVGSADFNNVEIDGQVNMALAPRQPGSSIKPFVYLSAFEQGDLPQINLPDGKRAPWTPGTLLPDITQGFDDGVNPDYVPVNYDGNQHGIVTLRAALANSYNIPVVFALDQIRKQGNGLEPFLQTMRDVGVTTLNAPYYGLSISLGAGEVPLLEMTTAYSVLANEGRLIPPVTILSIKESDGSIVCQMYSDDPNIRPCQNEEVPRNGEQVVSPVDAFLLTDILSDNEARTPSFGPNSVLTLPGGRPVAAKTGTTNDFRDNWTLGYTPQIVTGVWVGNADNSEMRNISGVAGAGPIWNDFMQLYHSSLEAQQFSAPEGVRDAEICAETGTAPSEACPQRTRGWFSNGALPLPAEDDLFQRLRVKNDDGAEEERVFKVYPPPYREWAEQNGIAQPPADAVAGNGDNADNNEGDNAGGEANDNGDEPVAADAEIRITSPREGDTVGDVVTVEGSANTTGFESYELQYGISHNPGAFSAPINGTFRSPVINSVLGQWDTRNLNAGPHTLRLLVRRNDGKSYVADVRLFVDNVAPTPLPPPTATWTATSAPLEIAPTATPTLAPPSPTVPPAEVEPTATLAVILPTETFTAEPPTVEPTPTETLVPTVEFSATPTETETPIAPPTETATITPTATITEGEPDIQPTPTWTPQS